MTNNNLKALTTNFELIALAGLVSLVADFLWVLHDIFQNGLSVTYTIIGFGLVVGILLTLVVFIRHNWSYGEKLDKSNMTNFYRKNGFVD